MPMPCGIKTNGYALEKTSMFCICNHSNSSDITLLLMYVSSVHVMLPYMRIRRYIGTSEISLLFCAWAMYWNESLHGQQGNTSYQTKTYHSCFVIVCTCIHVMDYCTVECMYIHSKIYRNRILRNPCIIPLKHMWSTEAKASCLLIV